MVGSGTLFLLSFKLFSQTFLTNMDPDKQPDLDWNLRHLERHGCFNKEKSRWKLKIYNNNVWTVLKHYNDDRFCYERAIFGKCKGNKNGKCELRHYVNILSLIDKKEFDDARLFGEYLLFCNISEHYNGELSYLVGKSLRLGGKTYDEYLNSQKYYLKSITILRQEYDDSLDNNINDDSSLKTQERLCRVLTSYGELLFYQLNNKHEAYHYFKESITIGELFGGNHYIYGKCLMNDGKYKQSLKHLNKAIELNEKDKEKKKENEYENEFEMTDSSIFYDHCYVLYKLKKYELSLMSFDKGEEIDKCLQQNTVPEQVEMIIVHMREKLGLNLQTNINNRDKKQKAKQKEKTKTKTKTQTKAKVKAKAKAKTKAKRKSKIRTTIVREEKSEPNDQNKQNMRYKDRVKDDGGIKSGKIPFVITAETLLNAELALRSGSNNNINNNNNGNNHGSFPVYGTNGMKSLNNVGNIYGTNVKLGNVGNMGNDNNNVFQDGTVHWHGSSGSQSIAQSQSQSQLQLQGRKNSNYSYNVLQHEFDVFWSKYSILDHFKCHYYKQLSDMGYNCVTLITYLTEDILKTQIGMNTIHCQAFIKLVESWKKEKVLFEDWLIQLGLYQEYYSSFERCGILTFESFYLYLNFDLQNGNSNYIQLRTLLCNETNVDCIDQDLDVMVQSTPKYERLKHQTMMQ